MYFLDPNTWLQPWNWSALRTLSPLWPQNTSPQQPLLLLQYADDTNVSDKFSMTPTLMFNLFGLLIFLLLITSTLSVFLKTSCLELLGRFLLIFLLILCSFSSEGVPGGQTSSFFFLAEVCLVTPAPTPALESTTWPQFLRLLLGNFLHLLTTRTQALHISPRLSSVSMKQALKSSSS